MLPRPPDSSEVNTPEFRRSFWAPSNFIARNKADGHWSKSRTPSEHPNPSTKIGSKMGGEFTYQPKWDPKTVLADPRRQMCFPTLSPTLSFRAITAPRTPSFLPTKNKASRVGYLEWSIKEIKANPSELDQNSDSSGLLPPGSNGHQQIDQGEIQ